MRVESRVFGEDKRAFERAEEGFGEFGGCRSRCVCAVRSNWSEFAREIIRNALISWATAC